MPDVLHAAQHRLELRGLGPGEIGAAEVGAQRVSALQVGAEEDGPAQRRVREDGVPQICELETGSVSDESLELGIT